MAAREVSNNIDLSNSDINLIVLLISETKHRMLSSVHIIQDLSPAPYSLHTTPFKRRNEKEKTKGSVEKEEKCKTKNLRSTPISNKYESTNSTSNCDDEELRIHSKAKQRLRLKLKRSTKLVSSEE